MAKHLFIFLVVLFSGWKHTCSQTICIDSTFSKSFILQTKSLYSTIRVPTIDNGMLMTIAENANNLCKHAVSKITPDGHVAWTKIFTPKGNMQIFEVTRLLQLTNGDYIVGGQMNYGNQQTSKKVILLKLNAVGDIIWQKQLNNNVSFTQDVSLQNLQEGYNRDIIVLTKDPNVLFNQNVVTRLDSNGHVVWSNAYYGNAFIIQSSANITGNDNALHSWAVSYGNKEMCFSNSEGLTSLQFNYTTGQLNSSKTYCIAPGSAPLGIQTIYAISSNPYGMITKRLSNGNTVIFLNDHGSNRNLLISLFDSHYNFVKSTIYSIPNYISPSHDVPTYNFDACTLNGDIVFSFYLRTHDRDYIYPFSFSVFLDSALNFKKQLFLQEAGLDTVFSSGRFLQDGKLNFVSSSRQSTDPVHYQINYSNTITGGGSGAFCNATDSVYGSFEPHELVRSGSNFKYDSVKINMYETADSNLFDISSFDILETTNCKIISVCDSLKLTGPEEVCLQEHNTIRYAAYKNPECRKEVEWSIDTSYANLIATKAGTSIELFFKKEGQCKLFIGLKGCDLKDSIIINISKPATGLKITTDPFLCPGKHTAVYATKGFRRYAWSNGSSADSLLARSAGFYKVTATDYCGNIFKDSIYIRMIDTAVNIKSSVIICLTDTVTIKVPEYVTDITWQPTINSIWQNNLLQFFPDRNTGYSINLLFNRNCLVRKSIEVTVEVCPETVFFPNTFTPNNDGSNDIFRPSVIRPLASYQLIIYNRYGQKVFESTNSLIGWDGTLKQSEQNSGAFIWQCSYRFAGKSFMVKKGHVLLLR